MKVSLLRAAIPARNPVREKIAHTKKLRLKKAQSDKYMCYIPSIILLPKFAYGPVLLKQLLRVLANVVPNNPHNFSTLAEHLYRKSIRSNPGSIPGCLHKWAQWLLR